jgi:hypothetical protein
LGVQVDRITAGRRPGEGGEASRADERERLQRRTGLELALAQAQAEFESASQPAHREMLRLKMEALRTELAELD